jgi:2-amino-4-hydroxy-6-hydroxymethyldihydropteridine diphosphokinase
MILLALGTNLGDRKANLEQALRELSTVLRVLRVSAVYETAALLPEGAPTDWDIPFYNIVVSAEATIDSKTLLMQVKAIEQRLGRQDVGRWGPRLIDIDILAHGTARMQEEDLTLPHAEMMERDFVMVPLAEIAPHWRHPVTGDAAHEWVRSKGMAIGSGLMRSPVLLNWREG